VSGKAYHTLSANVVFCSGRVDETNTAVKPYPFAVSVSQPPLSMVASVPSERRYYYLNIDRV
jgi:hypothetical protein